MARFNAPKVATAFYKALRSVEKLDPKILRKYLNGAATTRFAEFDGISALDSSIEKSLAEEDVLDKQAVWLKSRPGLQILDDKEIDAQIALRINAVPDKKSRLAAAKKAIEE